MLEVENYRTTVNALYCFSDFLGGNHQSARKCIGRRMTTSEHNSVSANTDQTPDLVVQISETEGYVCEAKASLCDDQDNWEPHLKQLKKYDDDLIGWWTIDQKLKGESNTILLVTSEKSRRFRNYTKQKGISFSKPIAYIGFIQKSVPEESILFQLDWGQIFNSKLNEEVDLGKVVHIEPILVQYGFKKFCDYPPPIELMMEILWSHVFNDLKTYVQYDENKRAWPIDIEVPSLTAELQKLYGQFSGESREVSFPQIKWVRNALDHFEVLGLAKKNEYNQYTVFYKQFRNELLERFSKARQKMNIKKQRKQQMGLPLTEIREESN